MDQTGQPGPATWQAGDFPERQDDYPVSGISWYEAAAYAEFAGKSLPTGEHWGTARGEHTTLIQVPQLGGFAILAPFSNFTGRVSFVRKVDAHSCIEFNGAEYFIRRKLERQYVVATLSTHHRRVFVKFEGKVIKTFSFPFVGKTVDPIA